MASILTVPQRHLLLPCSYFMLKIAPGDEQAVDKSGVQRCLVICQRLHNWAAAALDPSQEVLPLARLGSRTSILE